MDLVIIALRSILSRGMLESKVTVPRAKTTIRSTHRGIAAADRRRLVFEGNNDFQVELRRRVDDFFRLTGRRKRDCPAMYLKTATLFCLGLTFYALLVFAAQTWWHAIPLAILLALSMAAIGFNVQHDGGHQAYSEHPLVNRVMAMSLDLMGGSSYYWHWRHNVIHHTYPNISGYDGDVDFGVFGRATPHQRRLKFHRWQHFYLWPLYGLFGLNWQFVSDFTHFFTGRMAKHRVPRPKAVELAVFIAGKITFFALAFAIPLLFHSPLIVIVFAAIVSFVLSLSLMIVFQAAHCVEEAEFRQPLHDPARIDNAWAIHQIETTVNFSRHNRFWCWFLGGLNFQIEHHLFPKICHVNYPSLTKLVEETCREFGIKYREHRSLSASVVSHYRWLRRMGMPSSADLN